MESSAVLRMLRSSFLTTASTEKLSMLNLGFSSFPRVFPKSVFMVNARRIPRSITKLQALKHTNKSADPLMVPFYDFEDSLSVVVRPVFDKEEMEVVIRGGNPNKLEAHVTALRQAGLPLDRYVVKEEDDALYLKFDLPKLKIEDVLIFFSKDIFVIQITDPLSPNTRCLREVSGLSVDKYKVKETTAEMMFGLLRIVIRKIKRGEINDEIVVKGTWL